MIILSERKTQIIPGHEEIYVMLDITSRVRALLSHSSPSCDGTSSTSDLLRPYRILISYRVAKVRSSLKSGFISPNLKTCSKPAENLVFERKTCRNELKTGFLLDLVYEGLDKSCKPDWFIDSYKPGLSTFDKFHKPGLLTRELTKLNKTWFFRRFTIRF
jgi:hypothetical protein